jgi:hypothetical protein
MGHGKELSRKRILTANEREFARIKVMGHGKELTEIKVNQFVRILG